MRGEDTYITSTRSPENGSPPHARGRLLAVTHPDKQTGITPACAGKTSPRVPARRWRRDHPRMRGEDSTAGWEGCRKTGSPPHARGRLNRWLGGMPKDWITPACAGKTFVNWVSDCTVPDHPRMRGEDLCLMLFRMPRAGSPPHARGRRAVEHDRRVDGGITPACAGKTFRTTAPPPAAPDHPRMRGEDEYTLLNSTMGAGSPPHARGRRVHAAQLDDGGGITPACAGKTPSTPDRRTPWSDHPRMRGEDLRAGPVAVGQPGSPPHARGRLGPRAPRGPMDRITPACAGKTPARTIATIQREGSPPHARGRRGLYAVVWAACGDHPRMRGEDSNIEDARRFLRGSPPHARGRQQH